MKHDFNDEETLMIVESLARDGLDNKQIAEYLGYNETYFSQLVNSKPKLSEALKKGRKPLSFIVETSLYRRAVGGIKVRTITRERIERRCECLGANHDCPLCGGTGFVPTDDFHIREVEQELPGDTGAAALWLKQKKPTIWNKPSPRIENDRINTEPPKTLTKEEAKELWYKLDNEY